MIFQFFHLFWLCGGHTMLKITNFHQDWDKNSLFVIGHTHTNRTVPFTHQAQRRSFCGPSCGASQSVRRPCFFSHYIEICSSMANHLSHRPTTLPQACQAHLFTLWRRADTWGNQKVGFHRTEQHDQLPDRGGEHCGFQVFLCFVFLFVEFNQAEGKIFKEAHI